MTASRAAAMPPFDTALLDRLMQERGLDVLLVSSKHNVQYLLGGYRFFMFDYMDATGLSRYLPILIYPKGRPDLAAYIGNPNEGYERDLGRFWPGTLDLKARGSVDSMHYCLERIAASGIPVFYYRRGTWFPAGRRISGPSLGFAACCHFGLRGSSGIAAGGEDLRRTR